MLVKDNITAVNHHLHRRWWLWSSCKHRLSTCFTHFLSMWLTQDPAADWSEYGHAWQYVTSQLCLSRWHQGRRYLLANGCCSRGKSTVWGREQTSGTMKREGVTKICKKRTCKSAHNFWCFFRAHKFKEHKLPKSRFSGTSLFQLGKGQKCH